MEQEEATHSQRVSDPSSSSASTSNNVPSSSSSSSSSPSLPDQELDVTYNEEGNRRRLHSGISYRFNFSISDLGSSDMRDDVWSCLIVLLTFWFFASMTLILGLYGSVSLQLGPNCSRLVQASSLFVQSIQAQEIDGSKPGPMLYGFYEPPPLNVEITWSESHNASVQTSYHKEWIYFLNEGSKVDISYNVETPHSFPLSLVIAQGRESLVEWVDDPSYPNTTLSWNIIHGSGTIQQEISKSSNYYIAVGNLNSEDVQVELNFTIKALIYDTSTAYYKCYLSNHLCSVKLYFLRTHVAVLTSPNPEKDTQDYDWYIKISYGAQWVTYFIGSGVMTILILLAFKCWNMFHPTTNGASRFPEGEARDPLLSPKEDDMSSRGSSYDSVSNDDENLDEWLAVSAIEGQLVKDGENNNPKRLCVICYDALRDCFFLPCGHCATCFTCGTRIAEEDGNCPICRRKMKKVRKIFTV